MKMELKMKSTTRATVAVLALCIGLGWSSGAAAASITYQFYANNVSLDGEGSYAQYDGVQSISGHLTIALSTSGDYLGLESFEFNIGDTTYLSMTTLSSTEVQLNVSGIQSLNLHASAAGDALRGASSLLSVNQDPNANGFINDAFAMGLSQSTLPTLYSFGSFEVMDMGSNASASTQLDGAVLGRIAGNMGDVIVNVEMNGSHPIPEPSALLAFTSGFGVLSYRMRRRRD
jgi:hypothetical protein